MVTDSSKSRLAEAIRSIRSNINITDKNASICNLFFCIRGGKTFVALNLAGMLAVGGKRSILVDLDLRKPKVHHGFNDMKMIII